MTTKRTIEAAYNLSPMQQGMLFHSLLAPESGVYCEQLICTLLGNLDVPAFERAWQQVIDRNPVLRTAFAWKRLEKPVQAVQREVKLPLAHLDWRSLAADEQIAQLDAHLTADRRRGFDPTKAPLMRLTLIRLSDQAYRLVWSHHHILMDGWSMPILLKEVFILYSAYTQGRTTTLPPTRPYRDYIVWLQKQDLSAAETYWRKALAGFRVPTPLVMSRKRGHTGQSGTAEQELQLSVESSARLQALARQHGLTLSTVIQAAWGLLLSRYSRERDVVFGATVSGRPADLPGAESMIGLFINTLPVRIQVDSDAVVMTWLQNLQANLAELRQFEHSPLVLVQGWSDVPRDTPLFESILVFENYPVDAVLREQFDAPSAALGGLRIRDVRSLEQTNYPLTAVSGPGRQIGLKLSYDCARFEDGAITRMLGHWRTLLESMAAAPQGRVADLAMLTEAEREQVLFQWNATLQPQPHDLLVHQMFESQAARTPDAPALIFVPKTGPDIVLTYHELNARANQLAHYLRALGVGSETLVALMAERSPEMIIGLLGILKAGGAYLPIDPNYPAERIAYMLKDSSARVLMTQEHLLQRSNIQSLDNSIVLLDADWPVIARQPTRDGETRREGDPSTPLRSAQDDKGKQSVVEDLSPSPPLPLSQSLAYVIYTSGSTGRPKGVMVTHAGLANHALDLQRLYQIKPGDRALLAISLSFDAAGETIYSSLLNGGALVLSTNRVEMDGNALIEICEQQQITLLNVPAPVWHMWVEALAARGQPLNAPLRLLVTGGESPSLSKLATWLSLMPGRVSFANAYGPTEITIAASHFMLAGDDDILPRFAHLPIGQPGINMLAYVLDEHMNPVPIGAPGELYIGGAGVARGYLGRPELTAEKFVPNPFANRPTRLYRTGDLARWLPDGNLEFIGRVDTQVKIRGFRIEPSEVEAVLAECPGLAEAAVAVRGDAEGNHRLIGYIVPQQGAQADQAVRLTDIRDYLTQRLPDYMVPALFVALDALPRTPSGKIDRRALPAPEADTSRLTAEAIYVSPRTPDEELLAGIFGQLLGLSRVSAADSFFDLGGHSLLATRLASRVREICGVELPLRSLFEAPTVAGIAAKVAAARQASTAEPPPPIKAIPREAGAATPLSFAQQRLWFLDQLEPGNLFYNIPTVVRLHGSLDVAALSRALNEIVRRHEVLRTTFTAKGGVPVQVVAAAASIPLPVTDLTELAEADREAEAHRLTAIQARTPFDLSSGPLLRAHLFKLDADDHIAALVMHHIVTDGWSMGILIDELATLYDAFCRDGATSPLQPLPDLTLQYADYAAWQRNWLQGETLDQQLAYWKQQLAGAPLLLEVPTDRPRPAVQTSNGGIYTFRLSRALSDELTRFNRAQGVTLFMTLLAAYQALLARYAGQSDVIVGSAIANRTRAEIEPLIGFFVNTLVFRTRFDGDPSFKELINQVRETALAAYAHQDVPFEMLVDALQPERDLSHTPLFQAAFSLQAKRAAPMNARELPGLRLEPVAIEKGIAQFDMLLMISEDPDGIAAAWEYNSDLFDRTTIERMAGHLETLLAAAVAAPEQPVATLPLLSEAERRMMLEAWNDTAVPFPDDTTIHALIEAQAAAHPDAIAVEYIDVLSAYRGGEPAATLTYQQLNKRANQLAHYLLDLGVRADTLVGLSAERSLDMIIGILGILKAGGAYLPIDPNYPADRIAFMIQDSGIQVLLTQERLLETKLSAQQALRLEAPSCKVVRLDTDWPEIARNPTANIQDSTSNPQSLAYIIYTSGSTGRPKGALLRHRGLCNLADVQGRAFDIRPGKRILQFAPFSFDASVWETVMALRNGATLVLARQETIASGTELLKLLQAARITTVTLPPSLLAILEPSTLSDLETVIAAGERCSNDIVGQWTDQPGSTVKRRRFFNAYGPSETTVCASMHQCDPTVIWPFGGPPIGGPIANFQLYVVDQRLQPQPIGVPGELLIGGVGLAAGYLNRPELTAERFVEDPFVVDQERGRGGEGGNRLYRSGDLVRWLPDGVLEFLGRIDDQVKVRGFRIELGEIEAVLREHPAVRDAVVIALNDTLASYIIPAEGMMPRSADLREHLRVRLPEHMVPNTFTLLDAFPLSPAGKIDRKALPAPDQTQRDATADYVAPRTPVEERLVTMAAELLRLKRVGINDNFFELGGHSLLATQLISRIRDDFGVELPLRTLFEHPTVAGLAQQIAAAQQAQAVQAADTTKIAEALKRVQSLSPDQVKALLAAKKAAQSGKPEGGQ